MLSIPVRLLYVYVCTALLFSLVQGCKGLKNRADTSPDGSEGAEVEYNFIQNFTSRYNILYNANLMFEEEWEKVANSANRNYQIKQSVFDEPLSEGENPLMD